MHNGISVYKMPGYEQGLSIERNNTLYKYKRSKRGMKMEKLSTRNVKNKSACYRQDCHLDNCMLGSQLACKPTDLN
jgi:hypothetical protein